PVAPTGGVVLTTAGRIRGASRLVDNQLHLGGTPLDGEVLLAINAGQSGDQPLPGAIRLLNGEVWRAGL
ncbi:MAG: hypothetical protein GWO24_12165, partial [Akkermansiaceae bacterium]|nr:hypothetical protein [Akkermansiaceae bacterium]